MFEMKYAYDCCCMFQSMKFDDDCELPLIDDAEYMI